MDKRQKKAYKQELRDEESAVRAILNEWSPITGVPEDEAPDEYDCLVDKVLSLLHKELCTEAEVHTLIVGELTDHFGIQPPADTPEVAHRLYSVRLKPHYERESESVSGPFYVQKDVCIACCAPEVVAPLLIGFTDQGNHCYFKRQPENLQEVDQAIEALRVSCIAAHRYCGSDPGILEKLRKLGLDDQIDQ